MSKVITVGATALFACILCATPLSLRFSPEGNVSLSADSASARVGRPLTATSVAGVNRRVHRRAYRRGYDGYGAYSNPYRYGYGTYQPYGYASRPYGYGGYASQQYGYGGYASRPYNRYGYQQPYSGYGNRQWWQF